MSTRSVPQAVRQSQAPADESALDLFRRLLPRKMIAADREAMRLQALTPKPWALRRSEIWPNNDERVLCIVVDVDAAPAREIDPLGNEVVVSVAASTWLDGDVPTPNLVIENPRSGHAHLVWLLGDCIWTEVQPRAPRYAKAIQRALTAAIPGGDLGYGWPGASIHNPWSERYRVREIRREPYRLDDLAAGLDLESPPRRYGVADLDAPYGLEEGARNDGLFRWLIAIAGRVMR